jgi:thiamine biosynthesis lipoprotein
MPTTIELPVWSTTATLVVTDPFTMDTALAELRAELTAIDQACSRFRPDSEINRALSRPGQQVRLSPLLNEAMTDALRVAAATDYLVDPTVAAAVIAAGYDRDIAEVVTRTLSPRPTATKAAPGAWRIRHDADAALLTVPPGVGIDLGATAKALAADRAVDRVLGAVGGGVLVGIGGDIAVAGEPPDGGWNVAIGDDHRAGSATHQQVSITSGGLATSSTVARRWRTGLDSARSGWTHHIIDPRTGVNPDPLWRTASVAAGSCVDANAASTAAIVLGPAAPEWLSRQGLPALLVDIDGVPTAVAGWPTAELAA